MVSLPAACEDHHMRVGAEGSAAVLLPLLAVYGSALPSPSKSTPPVMAVMSDGCGVQLIPFTTTVIGVDTPPLPSQSGTAPGLAIFV